MARDAEYADDEPCNVRWAFTPPELERFAEAIVRRCADAIDREAAEFAAGGQQDMRDFHLSKLAILAEFGIEK